MISLVTFGTITAIHWLVAVAISLNHSNTAAHFGQFIHLFILRITFKFSLATSDR